MQVLFTRFSQKIQAQIPRATIPADAKWVIDIKVDLFKKTDLGKFFMDQLAKNGEGLNVLKEQLHFDPLTDLNRVTLFGIGQKPNESVVLVKGTFKHEHLLAKAKQNKHYKAREAGRHTIHSWVDEERGEGNRSHGCFYAKDTILMGGSADLVGTAVKVLDGKAASLQAQPGLPHPLLPKKPIIATILADLDALEKNGDGPGAAMLQNIQTIAFASGESQKKLWVQAVMIPNNAEAGKKIRDTIAGFLALAGLAQADDPRMQQLTQVVKATKVDFKNGKVIMSLEYPVDKLLGVLKAQQQIKR